MDSTANPYLFTATVLLAGLDGLGKKTELVWKDCKFFPLLMDERMRVEYGMDKSMPITLKEALDCLKRDAAVKTWIAEDLLKVVHFCQGQRGRGVWENDGRAEKTLLFELLLKYISK